MWWFGVVGCDGLQEPDTVHPPPSPNWGILTKIAGGFFWGVATGCVFSSEGCTVVHARSRYGMCVSGRAGPFIGENVRKPLPGRRSRAETGPVRTGKSAVTLMRRRKTFRRPVEFWRLFTFLTRLECVPW